MLTGKWDILLRNINLLDDKEGKDINRPGTDAGSRPRAEADLFRADAIHHLRVANGRIEGLYGVEPGPRLKDKVPRSEDKVSQPKDKISLPEDKQTPPREISLTFDGALVFPGFINSHDHLDFDLFPRIGNELYNNYREWGSDIHRRNKELIHPVLQIPKTLRVQWGVYKNLLAGVTTVVNHGKPLAVNDEIITVLQTRSLHSLGTEKNWKYVVNKYYKERQPIVIHIGEGTDAIAAKEIDSLIKWNIFKRALIGVHGVAMTQKQASSFQALVWCPDSNHFLLGKTASIDLLKTGTKILFGTDSTLTADWNLWEQLRLARRQGMVSDAGLSDMLTRTAADVWGLKDGGSIRENQRADLVIARTDKGLSGWDAFYALNPEDLLLVLHKGNIRLFDQELYDQLDRSGFPLNDFYRINVNGTGKYVLGNLPGLMKEIKLYYPSLSFPVSAQD